MASITTSTATDVNRSSSICISSSIPKSSSSSTATTTTPKIIIPKNHDNDPNNRYDSYKSRCFQKTKKKNHLKASYQLIVLFVLVVVVVFMFHNPDDDDSSSTIIAHRPSTTMFSFFVFVDASTVPKRKRLLIDDDDEEEQNQQHQQFYKRRRNQKQKQQPNNNNNPFSSSSSSSSSFDSSMHGTTTTTNNNNNKNDDSFVKDIFNNMMTTKKPRHIMEGIWYGMKSITTCTVMAVVSLFAMPFIVYHQKSKQQQQQQLKTNNNKNTNNNPMIGFIVGSIVGIVYATIFTIFGIGQAIHKIWQGIIATPSAIKAAHVGQIWNETIQEYDYYYLDNEATILLNQFNNKRSNNNNNNVIDTTYYDLLNVSTSASSKEIKRAYYRQALDIHPDKNKSNEAVEQFRQLHIAYLTLSDDEKREKYDKYGIIINTDDNNNNNNNLSPLVNFDPRVFYAILFNSQLVEPYIGELTIASYTDDLLHLAIKSSSSSNSSTNNNKKNQQQQQQKSSSPEDVLKTWLWDKTNNNDYKVRKRQVDIALFLRNQVESYVSGELSAIEFRDVCHIEAKKIADGSLFGVQFLQAIGTAMILESNQFLGYQHLYSIPGLLSGTVSLIRKKIKRIQRLWNSIQKAFAVLRLVVATYEQNYSNKTSSSPEFKKLNEDELIDNLHKFLPAILDMAWAYNYQDISFVIHGALQKLFIDSGANSRYKRMERAEAVKILGEEFIKLSSSRTTPSTTTTTTASDNNVGGEGYRNNTGEDLMARLEVAFHVSYMKASGQDIPKDSETLIRQRKRKNRKKSL